MKTNKQLVLAIIMVTAICAVVKFWGNKNSVQTSQAMVESAPNAPVTVSFENLHLNPTTTK